MSKTQALGIDLGTSNCAMALTEDGTSMICPVVQLAGANKVGESSTFASECYLPHENQFPPDSTTLPWQEHDSGYIAGNFARESGSLVPDRVITSAKSWLCHRTVDPRQPALPWKTETVKEKVSAFEVTRRYLQHFRNSYEHRCEQRGISPAFAATQVVVTVPASFDEAARTLTAQAAIDAGWGEDIILLEEPQAAFYAWLGTTEKDWRKEVTVGDIILICDIGGGTTDFSLIAVVEHEGNLELARISVGDHILLGGDNMDLALAFAVRQKLEEEDKEIDDWQFMALVHAVRKAKEQLFKDDSLAEIPISIPSRGSGLFAGTISTHLSRDMVQAVIIDGFFSLVEVDQMPQEHAAYGLQEFGLPYTADPVVSKHLAAFLTKSLHTVRSNDSLSALLNARGDRLSSTYLHPDAILFNGGVFQASVIRNRIRELLQSWAPELQIRELGGTDLNLAVARGASLYGYNKLSKAGVRIRAGVSRSYYIGLETSMPAIPGYKPPAKAVCVAEQGMEEGDERVLEEKEFGLVTGATVTFRFFSSSARSDDTMGTVVKDAEKELEETTSLEMTLPPIEGFSERSIVPVKLHSRLNELGILELWMQHTQSQQRWNLTFSVRTE